MRTIFWIRGNNLQGSTTSAFAPESYAPYISENTKIIQVGDQNGTSMDIIWNTLGSNLPDDPKANKIEIIIYAHGHLTNHGLYIISLQKDNLISLISLFCCIKTLVNENPVKILLTSCYGENAHNHMNLLPPGSILITLSEKTIPTTVKHTPPQEIFKNIISDSLTIEKVIELWMLSTNHQFIFNPIISFYKADCNIFTTSFCDILKNCLKKENNYNLDYDKFTKRLNDCLSSERTISFNTDEITNLIKQVQNEPKLLQELSQPWLESSFPELKVKIKKMTDQLLEQAFMETTNEEPTTPMDTHHKYAKIIFDHIKDNSDKTNELLNKYIMNHIDVNSIDTVDTMLIKLIVPPGRIFSAEFAEKVNCSVPTFLLGLSSQGIAKYNILNGIAAYFIEQKGIEHFLPSESESELSIAGDGTDNNADM